MDPALLQDPEFQERVDKLAEEYKAQKEQEYVQVKYGHRIKEEDMRQFRTASILFGAAVGLNAGFWLARFFPSISANAAVPVGIILFLITLLYAGLAHPLFFRLK